jgi:hypothetical protein
LSGFSALRFLREARLDFLRSSLVSLDVFAMNAVNVLFFFVFLSLFSFYFYRMVSWWLMSRAFSLTPSCRETRCLALRGVTAEAAVAT